MSWGGKPDLSGWTQGLFLSPLNADVVKIWLSELEEAEVMTVRYLAGSRRTWLVDILTLAL